MSVSRSVLLIQLILCVAGDPTIDTRLLSKEDHVVFQGQVVLNDTVLVAPSQNYTLIHIPKTAGASFLVESPRHMPRGTTLRGNREKPFLATKPSVPSAASMVILLRDPIKHVLSQFLECKYAPYGQQVTKGTGFPLGSNNNNNNSGIYGGFEEWIDHFRSKNESTFGKKGAYHCYDPSNMQTRFLVNDRGAHFVRNASELNPSLDQAKLHLESIGLVGISDYYDASVCLLEYHSLGGVLLPQYCLCNGTRLRLSQVNETRLSHGVPKHSIQDLSDAILSKVHDLVQIDMKLYQHALRLFKHQLQQVWNTTGVDLLCGNEWSDPSTNEVGA